METRASDPGRVRPIGLSADSVPLSPRGSGEQKSKHKAIFSLKFVWGGGSILVCSSFWRSLALWPWHSAISVSSLWPFLCLPVAIPVSVSSKDTGGFRAYPHP